MSRLVVSTLAAIAIAALALFVPIDGSLWETAGLTRTEVSSAAATAAAEDKARPDASRRSLSAALSDATTPAPDTRQTLAPAPSRQAAPATAEPLPTAGAPATLPFANTPLFTHNMSPNAYRATAVTMRALQRELTRHGCYKGVIDGDWGPASRYAAATFTHAVNATLPVDRPDAVLLALLRRHPGSACANNQATSSITTAATIPTHRAQPPAHARPLTSPAGTAIAAQAPRIVRSNGAPAIATVTPTAPPVSISDPATSRMALGIELPANGPGAPGAVTREPEQAGQPPSVSSSLRRAERRNARRQRARERRRARSRKHWRQQVYRAIDLNGN